MNNFDWDHKPFRRNAILAMALVVLGLAVHEIFGDHGYLALRSQKQEYKTLQQNIHNLSRENQELQEKIKALKTNPEIKSLDLNIEQRQLQVKSTRGGYYPALSLQGDFAQRSRDVGGSQAEWLGGVFLEFPFFEGGLTRAQTAAASSQYLQALERKRDRLNSLRVDLTIAWRDEENARQGAITTKQTVATNQEAYDSAQALYRNGKAVGIDVLQAEVDLTTSRFSAIRYAVNYEIARARIKQLTGSGDVILKLK